MPNHHSALWPRQTLTSCLAAVCALFRAQLNKAFRLVSSSAHFSKPTRHPHCCDKNRPPPPVTALDTGTSAYRSGSVAMNLEKKRPIDTIWGWKLWFSRAFVWIRPGIIWWNVIFGWRIENSYTIRYYLDWGGYLVYRIQEESISSSLPYQCHFRFILWLFKTWIWFIVECSETRTSDNNDTFFENWHQSICRIKSIVNNL
jgi:hypothetical protein